MALLEIEQAIDYFKRGEPGGAIPLLEELVAQVPTYVIAHVLLAQAYETIQQDEKANAAWKRAYQVIPNSPALKDGQWNAQPKTEEELIAEIMRAFPDPDDDPMSPTRWLDKADQFFPEGISALPDEGYADEAAHENLPPLRAVGLTKRYKKRTVVKAVELEVRQGEIVGLLGPNGAGKTTTFYMIVGLVRPNSGRIYLGERDITRKPMYKRSRLGVGYLAQESSVFTHLSVEENLYAVLEYQRMSRAARRERVEELINEFGLERVRKSKGYMLSGGERRRCEIARALATRPSFFLLDEPFAGVDPIAVEDIQHIVSSLKKKGIGVLITDHNVHETLAITDRAYLLYEGKILKHGTAEALASDPEVRKRYLGENFTLERYQARSRQLS